MTRCRYGFEMVGNLTIEVIQSLVTQGLRRTGLTQHKASMLATGKRDALRAIGYGKMPSVDRWQAICHVLGIPFDTGFEPVGAEGDFICYRLIDGSLDVVSDFERGSQLGPVVGDWAIVEIGDATCRPYWSEGDRLWFDRSDPLANMSERLIGRWCLVTTKTGSAESGPVLGRCRRPDNDEPDCINLEYPTGAPTRIDLKPAGLLPLRLVLPRV